MTLPSGWDAFALKIRAERARGRCECTGGPCGRDHRTLEHAGRVREARCPRRIGDRVPGKGIRSRTKLTVVHVCNCGPEARCLIADHVVALCDECRELHDPTGRMQALARQAAESAQHAKRDLGETLP